ncbi:hypothetical protein [Collimonas humicola]|uniref:hypothetical protein n=1 Tax=Collimonas humicola TaxID=2825886 RepID=UPI001B8BBFBF|nr:hypothetical protein [Collimonas humicola]
MSTKPESKQTIAATVGIEPVDKTEQKQPADTATTTSPAVKLKAAIEQLDADRTALVKSTIENLKPGKPLDHAALRDINKIETRKNRLIVARFAALLKKSDPAVQAIVHQIIEI